MPYKSNTYAFARYRVTLLNNALTLTAIAADGGVLTHLEVQHMITYKQLVEHIRAIKLASLRGSKAAGTQPQALKNEISRLSALIKAAGKTVESAIENDFDLERFRRLVSAVSERYDNPRTRRDVVSSLSRWREVYTALKADRGALDAADTGPDVPASGALARTLRDGLQARDMSQQSAAKLAGVPIATLEGWLAGRQPRPSRASDLRKLEQVLCLDRETLTRFLNPGQVNPGTAESGGTSHRRMLIEARKDPFRLPLSRAGKVLKEQWRDYLEYKISDVPELSRAPKAQWSLQALKNVRPNLTWANSRDGQYCPSADVSFKHVAGYLGWLIERSGLVDQSVTPSLALFLIPKAYEDYESFLIKRCGGTVTNTVRHARDVIRSFTKQVTGYLRQRPDLAECLPEILRPEDWRDACDRLYAVTLRAPKGSGIRVRDGKLQVPRSRDPHEPIRSLINADEPLSAIADLVLHLDKLASWPGTNRIAAARHKRDALLLQLLIYVPMRLQNVALLSLTERSHGRLVRAEDRIWKLEVPQTVVKNNKMLAFDLTFELSRRIEDYVNNFRSCIADSESHFVFVASDGGRRPWWSANQRVFELTKKYIPGCVGFHIHQLRSLVATRLGSDIDTAAILLGDTRATVERNYRELNERALAGRAFDGVDQVMRAARQRRA